MCTHTHTHFTHMHMHTLAFCILLFFLPSGTYFFQPQKCCLCYQFLLYSQCSGVPLSFMNNPNDKLFASPPFLEICIVKYVGFILILRLKAQGKIIVLDKYLSNRLMNTKKKAGFILVYAVKVDASKWHLASQCWYGYISCNDM